MFQANWTSSVVDLPKEEGQYLGCLAVGTEVREVWFDNQLGFCSPTVPLRTPRSPVVWWMPFPEHPSKIQPNTVV